MQRMLLTVIVVLLVAPNALAQSESLPLPSADDLGPGWEAVPATPTTGDPDYPQAYQLFVGPDGSRLDLFVAAPPERIAETIWTQMASQLDANDPELVFFPEHAAPNSPLIPGCSDVRRLWGKDLSFGVFPDAITACRTGEAILRIHVSGQWQDLEGIEASDALVELLRTLNT